MEHTHILTYRSQYVSKHFHPVLQLQIIHTVAKVTSVQAQTYILGSVVIDVCGRGRETRMDIKGPAASRSVST